VFARKTTQGRVLQNSSKTLRQAQGERDASCILFEISVRGELVEPQIGLFARASDYSKLHSKEYSSKHSDRDREGKRNSDESVLQYAEKQHGQPTMVSV
jgi:hypothetical protein